ncbi:MAG: hypothetical protein UX70_C0001G0541 [Candidatus Wolfebacteria bacterium GW2011_GWB1_47_1]|uniref:Uncharacterized protein n=1 Tax=Candidatus Wolfebacteria bacterium GW2011_GWB1_47_1 TaxID=1619007 RepID=A0A0G4ARD6_9BACT|nr:MAG: hypothetical protein UX70_C0001G0541 [Candidatus Wolfebacteria bacterium GW2011_GWB1_47_1]
MGLEIRGERYENKNASPERLPDFCLVPPVSYLVISNCMYRVHLSKGNLFRIPKKWNISERAVAVLGYE